MPSFEWLNIKKGKPKETHKFQNFLFFKLFTKLLNILHEIGTRNMRPSFVRIGQKNMLAKFEACKCYGFEKSC